MNSNETTIRRTFCQLCYFSDGLFVFHNNNRLDIPSVWRENLIILFKFYRSNVLIALKQGSLILTAFLFRFRVFFWNYIFIRDVKMTTFIIVTIEWKVEVLSFNLIYLVPSASVQSRWHFKKCRVKIT